jgi:hypothetical protein
MNPGTTWEISIESLMGERNKIKSARTKTARDGGFCVHDFDWASLALSYLGNTFTSSSES